VLERADRRFDAVLFDFGGVIVSSPFALLDAVGPGALELFLGDYDEDNDHPWHRLERGEMAFQDYWDDVLMRATAAGVDLDPTRLAGLYGRLDVHEPVVERVRSLRADGYLTAIVTNNVREFGSAWRSKVPLDELFDVVVDSCEVGMRKPNPRIYLHALEQLGGVLPDRAVFLDDAPGNVTGARAAGLAAIHVTSFEQALAELEQLLNE
jgi:putative hydrolase of the HAD superfamily